MLQKETVSTGTLELLNALMSDNKLANFFLVGGTALALQIGHRMSIDIDLFTKEAFDENELSEYLEAHKGLKLSYINKNTIKGQINYVQVDLITHSYPLVENLVIEENIRMASLADIAAMKLNAIAGNGTRLKDFVDIEFLSSHLSLSQMLNAYSEKYNTRSPVIPIKALGYFKDINFNEPINYIKTSYKWDTIKERLLQMIQFPEEIFESV